MNTRTKLAVLAVESGCWSRYVIPVRPFEVVPTSAGCLAGVGRRSGATVETHGHCWILPRTRCSSSIAQTRYRLRNPRPLITSSPAAFVASDTCAALEPVINVGSVCSGSANARILGEMSKCDDVRDWQN
jgi:hypothetical protein